MFQLSKENWNQSNPYRQTTLKQHPFEDPSLFARFKFKLIRHMVC